MGSHGSADVPSAESNECIKGQYCKLMYGKHMKHLMRFAASRGRDVRAPMAVCASAGSLFRRLEIFQAEIRFFCISYTTWTGFSYTA